MPPVALALAPLAASALGSTILPAVAGSSLLGIGTSTLGGVLGGALAGGLTSEDPLTGALLGGATGGIGGSGIAEGLGSLAGGVGDALGLGADAALAAGAEGAAGSTAGSLAASAADLASPTVGSAGITTGLESATAGGAFTGGAAGDLMGALGAGSETAGLASPAAGAVGDATALLASPTSTALTAAGGVGGVGGATGEAAAGAIGTETPGWLARNADWLLPAAGVAAAGGQQALGGNELTENLERLAQSNAAIASQGVPPGVTAGIKSASEAAKARVRSMFASQGMSGSSSEAVALANIDQTAAKHGGELAMGLVQRGLQANQMNAGIYQILLRNALNQDKALAESIGRFTQAMAA